MSSPSWRPRKLSDDLWLPSPLEMIEVPIREYVNWEKTKNALRNIGDLPVKKVMTHRVVTATGDMDIEAAAALMLKEGIARLPVLTGKGWSEFSPVPISYRQSAHPIQPDTTGTQHNHDNHWRDHEYDL